MDAAPEILHKHGINAQHGILVPLYLDHVAHGQRSHIAAVFKISRVERLFPHLVENLAALRPFRENWCRTCRDRSRDVFVFVVFLGSPDNRILRHIFDHLRDFRLRQREIHD